MSLRPSIIVLGLAILINLAYYLAPSPPPILFPIGSRVWFWDAYGIVTYGTVQSRRVMEEVCDRN
jgi:hypothetical protein